MHYATWVLTTEPRVEKKAGAKTGNKDGGKTKRGVAAKKK
jgi:hypothetical protein